MNKLIERGYACVGLSNPKSCVNVGSAMRACGVYRAAWCAYTGQRWKKKGGMLITDPSKYYRHVPLFRASDLRDIIPYDCVPVAIELHDHAQSLVDYQHPERAFYIFGPEDGTLGHKTLDWCRDIVQIPTSGCMNLAATVNVVLYDRFAKMEKHA